MDELSGTFLPPPFAIISDEQKDFPQNLPTHGFFITEDGYLISNYHVVKDAMKVRLLTGLRRDEVATATQAGAGLIDAKVVQVDAAYTLHQALDLS